MRRYKRERKAQEKSLENKRLCLGKSFGTRGYIRDALIRVHTNPNLHWVTLSIIWVTLGNMRLILG